MYQTSGTTTVLIVEDNHDHQALIKFALQTHLNEVLPLFVDTAERAILYLNDCLTQRQFLPKLVLLDLYLPEREQGLMVLRELKTNPKLHQIPVIVLSVSRDAEDILNAYDSGANSYVAKPVDHQQWLDYIKKLRHYWWDIATLPH